MLLIYSLICGYRIIYAMSRDKDVRTCLQNVLSVVPHDHIHFAQVPFFLLLLIQKIHLVLTVLHLTFFLSHCAVQKLQSDIKSRVECLI
jgi:hypothetical protein